ncbi:MAG: TolC family protein [Desulfobacterales bacterium]
MLLCGGCFRLGPEYEKPELGTTVPDTFQNAPSETAPLPLLSDRWWTEFGDPVLSHTVDSVLAHNHDIEAAAARVTELRALAKIERADRFPELGADGAWNYRESYTKSASGDAKQVTSRFYGLSFPAFFELDVWGRLAKGEEAAIEEVLSGQERHLAVAQTVVAEAIRLYFEIESIERRIGINLQLIDNFRRNLVFVDRRYRLGLANVLDVRQARRILAEAEAQVPALYRDLGSTQQEMRVLMGEYPTNSPSRNHPESYYQEMADIPPGIPSFVLRQRPDIRSAESRLRSLNARVGEALANRFPRISLTGSLGFETENLDRLFKKESHFRDLGAGITQPLFDAGRLKAGQDAAQARLDEAAAEYRQIALTAFAEVERALLTRQKERIRRSRLIDFLEEARKTQQVAENRYARGLTGYLDVLDAQRARFRAEENVVSVDLALMVNRVNLYLAVGGSWGAAEIGIDRDP